MCFSFYLYLRLNFYFASVSWIFYTFFFFFASASFLHLAIWATVVVVVVRKNKCNIDMTYKSYCTAGGASTVGSAGSGSAGFIQTGRPLSAVRYQTVLLAALLKRRSSLPELKSAHFQKRCRHYSLLIVSVFNEGQSESPVCLLFLFFFCRFVLAF